MASTKSGREPSCRPLPEAKRSPASRLAAALRRLAADESGSNGVEYAVLLTMVGAALVGVLAFAGDSLNDLFNGIGSAIPDIPAADPAAAPA